jgi:Family of unknown function (DUF6186)
MSSHDVVVAVYLLLGASLVGLAVLGRRPGSPIPSLGTLVTWATDTRARHLGVVLAWAWLGVHLFAR